MYFPDVFFAILHTNWSSRSFTVDINLLLKNYSADTLHSVTSNFVKYTSYRKIFEIKAVNLNDICITCHVPTFCTRNCL
jgi:hypothetical protein